MKRILIVSLLVFVCQIKTYAESGWGGSIDISLGTASTSTYAQLLVVDPLGRKTGFIPNVGEVRDIPESSYVLESVDDYSGENNGNESVVFLLNSPIAGRYNFVLIGLGNSNYSFQIHVGDSEGKDVLSSGNMYSGVIGLGTSQQYLLDYAPDSGGSVAVVKDITFDTLRGDVSVTQKLGRLGDSIFAASLINNVNQAEKLAGVCDKRKRAKTKSCGPATALLRLFVKRLELANRKCDTTGGCDEGPELAAFEKAHRGDRDYDDFFRAWDKDDWHKWKKTSKRFVTDEALAIIRGDAEALIKTLEPSPKEPGKR